MSKHISAQPRYQLLVANLREGSDPSRGRNPVKARTGFEFQHFPVVGRAAPDTEDRDGGAVVETHMGRVGYTTPPVPVGAAATIVVDNTAIVDGTLLYLGDYALEAGVDFATTGGTVVVGEDITNTPPDNIIVIFKTSGAGGGEGTINYPANLPLVPGSVTITWQDGGAQTMTDDGVGGFLGASGNPAGSSIDYTTGEIVLDTTGNAPDAATAITIDYTGTTTGDVAVNLAAAIDALPDFAAPVPGASTITVTGPAGPTGNELRLDAFYTGSVVNFTLTPADGTFDGAEPFIGPPTILP